MLAAVDKTHLRKQVTDLNATCFPLCPGLPKRLPHFKLRQQNRDFEHFRPTHYEDDDI